MWISKAAEPATAERRHAPLSGKDRHCGTPAVGISFPAAGLPDCFGSLSHSAALHRNICPLSYAKLIFSSSLHNMRLLRNYSVDKRQAI